MAVSHSKPVTLGTLSLTDLFPRRLLRFIAGAALVALGAAMFWYVFAHRQIDELIELSWLAHVRLGTPFWTDWELWGTVLDSAVQPSVYFWAAAAPGLLLVSGASRRVARVTGLALLAWTLFAAFRTFPPFLDRRAFDPVPWGPFVNALAVGGIPALAMACLPAGSAHRGSKP